MSFFLLLTEAGGRELVAFVAWAALPGHTVAVQSQQQGGTHTRWQVGSPDVKSKQHCDAVCICCISLLSTENSRPTIWITRGLSILTLLLAFEVKRNTN